MNDKVQRLAEEEIDDLIVIAGEFISFAKEAHSHVDPEKIGEVTTWLSRTGQLFRKLYDSQGQHFENYTTLTKQYSNHQPTQQLLHTHLLASRNTESHKTRAGKRATC